MGYAFHHIHFAPNGRDKSATCQARLKLFIERLFTGVVKLKIDWHSALLTRATIVDKSYKNTQNVRRFMVEACGEDFRFDREFMAWIRNDMPKTLGDVVDEWQRRHSLNPGR